MFLNSLRSYCFLLPFSDLSSEINRFEISLSNKTKKSKESDICKYTFLKWSVYRAACTCWYKLSSFALWHPLLFTWEELKDYIWIKTLCLCMSAQCSCVAFWAACRGARWLTSGSRWALMCLWRELNRAPCVCERDIPWRKSCQRKSIMNSKK